MLFLASVAPRFSARRIDASVLESLMVHMQMRRSKTTCSQRDCTQAPVSTYHSFTGRVFFGRYLYILSSCLRRSFCCTFGGTYTSPASKGRRTGFGPITHCTQKTRQSIQVNDKNHRPLSTTIAGLGAGTNASNIRATRDHQNATLPPRNPTHPIRPPPFPSSLSRRLPTPRPERHQRHQRPRQTNNSASILRRHSQIYQSPCLLRRRLQRECPSRSQQHQPWRPPKRPPQTRRRQLSRSLRTTHRQRALHAEIQPPRRHRLHLRWRRARFHSTHHPSMAWHCRLVSAPFRPPLRHGSEQQVHVHRRRQILHPGRAEQPSGQQARIPLRRQHPHVRPIPSPIHQRQRRQVPPLHPRIPQLPVLLPHRLPHRRHPWLQPRFCIPPRGLLRFQRPFNPHPNPARHLYVHPRPWLEPPLPPLPILRSQPSALQPRRTTEHRRGTGLEHESQHDGSGRRPRRRKRRPGTECIPRGSIR